MADSKFLKWQDLDNDKLIDSCPDLGIVPEPFICPKCMPNPSAIVPDWRKQTIAEPFLNEKICYYQITAVTGWRTTVPVDILEQQVAEDPEAAWIGNPEYASRAQANRLAEQRQEDAGYSDTGDGTTGSPTHTGAYYGGTAVMGSQSAVGSGGALSKGSVTSGADRSAASQSPVDYALQVRFNAYLEEAIDNLLLRFNKRNNQETRQLIKDSIEYTDYDLKVRSSSVLKLLYSVPAEVVDNIEDEPERDEPEPDERTDTKKEFLAGEIKALNIKVRKGLHLYSRYLKIYQTLEHGNVLFEDTRAVFNLGNYADFGLFPESLLADAMLQLDDFFISQGYNLVGIGGIFVGKVSPIGKEKVNRVRLTWDKDFKIKKIAIWTDECPRWPKIFGKKKLKYLQSKSAWRDPTCMAYFANMREMAADLSARQAYPWLEFLKKHTYPTVIDTIQDWNETPENTIGSCIAGALEEEGKQLGQDILDEVFSIGDAIAYMWHKSICRDSTAEALEDLKKSGLRYDPESGEKTTVMAMATEQAFRELQRRNQPFLLLCASMLGIKLYKGPDSIFDEIWEQGLDKLKICGLFDLMSDAIRCLMNGLTLEQALAIMVKNAVRAMGIENFGQLFIGLPPDKQDELDALVRQKIESGDIFPDPSGAQNLSDRIEGSDDVPVDTPFFGKTNWVKPWEQPDKIRDSREGSYQGDYGATQSPIGHVGVPDTTPQRDERTLAQQFDFSQDTDMLDSNIVMEAYMQALLETYGDNLLALVDELNKFPGAPIVAFLLAAIDCPRPPIFQPGIMDFIKDLDLPFCRNVNDITLPMLMNPFAWMDHWTDVFGILWEIMKQVLQQLLLQILLKLLVKLCEIIGNTICRALGTTGALAASIPAVMGGRTTFYEVVKDSICGPDADDDQIKDTLTDMFNSLGAGGAGLADREAVVSFAEELSAATTRKELVEAVMGEPSEDFLEAVDTILEFDFPELRGGLGNRRAVGSFFANCGKLMPIEFRDQLRDFLREIPEGDELPANPSLCASPDDLENFKKLRCELLEGRATKEQCDHLFDSFQGKALEDLDDLTSIMQEGIPQYITKNLPPIVSDPGCDNGLLPYEPAEAIAAQASTAGSNMEKIKIAYSTDMLGNGNLFVSDASWGFVNMILSDTMGNPLSAHQRKAFSSKSYVDFYLDLNDNLKGLDAEEVVGAVACVKWQEGAFPTKVADWLQEKITELDPSFQGGNTFQNDKIYSHTFEDLGFTSFLGSDAVDLIDIDIPSYNVKIQPLFSDERVKFTKRGRKSGADLKLEFRDNNKGYLAQGDGGFSYGFNLSLYLSDLVQSTDDPAVGSLSKPVNRMDDNARIIISDVYNTQATLSDAAKAMMTEEQIEDFEDSDKSTSILKYRRYEFLATDNGFNPTEINLADYPKFAESFSKHVTRIPQVLLLSDLTGQNASAVNTTYNSIVSDISKKIFQDIAENNEAFNYGAEFDKLTALDLEYVVDSGTTESPGGTLYEEAQVKRPDGEDGYEVDDIENEDAILGISRMQWNVDQGNTSGPNRVFYLNPAQFGGSYTNPPLYISPSPNKGWLGMIDVMFPEIGPCKPQRTDLVDFKDIAGKISSTYPQIPEDGRLKNLQECVVEKPYHRILHRDSKSNIEGLIYATIRVFGSVHIMKSLATFSKFYPDFINLYSSIYPSYVLEVMEEGLKDAQGDFWEWFSPFKDNEFWYAFLEQCVQLYGRRVDAGDIPNGHAEPPPPVQAALDRLNDMQENYQYPYEDELKEAKAVGEAGNLQTLKDYREEKNLEFVQRTEELAKVIAKEFVIEELQVMGKKFMDNLGQLDMSPTVFDADYYLLENFCLGTKNLTLDKIIKEEVVDLPTNGTELYTSGAEFVYADGDNKGKEYIGYFYVANNPVETGSEAMEIEYRTGERPSSGPYDVLRPLASKVKVPIGDVEEYGQVVLSGEKKLVLEKYISVNGQRMSPTSAVTLIKNVGGARLISSVYPGTLELVYDHHGREVGIQGHLGVRYGVCFSILAGSEKKELAYGEVDALDTSCEQIAPFEGDSKILLCTLKILKEDPTFKLIAQYIFPTRKLISLAAIYNDMGFLPSIGELTAAPGKDGVNSKSIATKPGRRAEVTINDDGSVTAFEAGTDGWAFVNDREPGLFSGMFVKEWDNWDQVVLRNSKSAIKRAFRVHYHNRDFNLEMEDQPSGATIFLQGLRDSLRPRPGQRLLPWFKRGRLRSNPFDANGKLCDK